MLTAMFHLLVSLCVFCLFTESYVLEFYVNMLYFPAIFYHFVPHRYMEKVLTCK